MVERDEQQQGADGQCQGGADPSRCRARQDLQATRAFSLLAGRRRRQKLHQSAVRARNPFGCRGGSKVQRTAGTVSENIIGEYKRLYTQLYP